jgi:uncharacterized YigZ family protein
MVDMLQSGMRILLTTNQTEIEVRKSRFIAIARTATSADEVKKLVALVRKEHPQANHVAHAAVWGPDGSQFSMSDDHEPKNTAGRPVLEILKGSGITNIIVLVARYFGGTLLGTGGLVKAYGDAAKSVLDGLKTEELIKKDIFTLEIGYDLYDQIRKLLHEYEAQTNEEFGTLVIIKGTVAAQKTVDLNQAISNLSSGRHQLTIG